MVVKQAAHLPPTLQWWRTLTQWSGGLGVLIWIKYFIDSFEPANSFYDDDQFDTSLLPAISASINGTLTIYTVATGLAVIVFYAAGIEFWEALNHGLTGITGGFTITNDSLYHHSDKYVAIKMPLMLVGALHFGLMYEIFSKGRIKAFFTHWPTVLFFGLMIVGAVSLHALNMQLGDDKGWFHDGFQWFSALTTCGLQSESVAEWSEAALMLLMLAMVVGGLTNSTAGGLRTKRVWAVLKGVFYYGFVFLDNKKKDIKKGALHDQDHWVSQFQSASSVVIICVSACLFSDNGYGYGYA